MVVDIKQISSMEKVFLDEAPKCNEFTSASALKGERFSYQIAISQQEEEIANFEFKVESDFPCDVSIFEVGNVPVTMPCYKTRDENYLRTTPGVYPDILNPKTDENLSALNILNASSLNLVSLLPTQRIILFSISLTEENISTRPSLGLYARAFTVKSRLERSSFKSEVKLTKDGFLLSRYFPSNL